MHTKARHETISFEVGEWSEQLRSVTSVWLGGAAVGFESASVVPTTTIQQKMKAIMLLQTCCIQKGAAKVGAQNQRFVAPAVIH